MKNLMAYANSLEKINKDPDDKYYYKNKKNDSHIRADKMIQFNVLGKIIYHLNHKNFTLPEKEIGLELN